MVKIKKKKDRYYIYIVYKYITEKIIKNIDAVFLFYFVYSYILIMDLNIFKD